MLGNWRDFAGVLVRNVSRPLLWDIAGVPTVNVALPASSYASCSFTHKDATRTLPVLKAPHDDPEALPRDSLEACSIHGQGFVEKNLPLVWLRDHCRCRECTHETTIQRIFDTETLAVSPVAKKATFSEVDGVKCLAVVFEDEAAESGEHVGLYPLRWLARHAHFVQKKEENYYSAAPYTLPNQKELRENLVGDKAGEPVKVDFSRDSWDGGLTKEEISHSYEDVMGSQEGADAWANTIRDYGVSLVHGVPQREEGTSGLVERLAPVRNSIFGALWGFEADMGAADLAYTSEGLPFHNDGTYTADPPGLQTWQCLRSADTGGETTLLDGVGSFRRLPPPGKALLSFATLPFQYLDPGSHQLRELHTPASLGPGVGSKFLKRLIFNNGDRAPIPLDGEFWGSPQHVDAFYRVLATQVLPVLSGRDPLDDSLTAERIISSPPLMLQSDIRVPHGVFPKHKEPLTIGGERRKKRGKGKKGGKKLLSKLLRGSSPKTIPGSSPPKKKKNSAPVKVEGPEETFAEPVGSNMDEEMKEFITSYKPAVRLTPSSHSSSSGGTKAALFEDSLPVDRNDITDVSLRKGSRGRRRAHRGVTGGILAATFRAASEVGGDDHGSREVKKERYFSHPLEILLRPGTVLAIDNWSVMHGRREFTGPRKMVGCYLNHEDLASSIRVQGSIEEDSEEPDLVED